MFEIHVSDSNVSAGSIPIRWCFDRNSYEQFKGGKVVIIVSPVGSYEKSTREKRFVVDVTESETYITFKYPGENRIFAYVYNPIKGGYVDHHHKVLERRFQSYTADVINHQKDGGDWLPYMVTRDFDPSRAGMGLKDFEVAKPFDVDVPVEVFGREPSALERAWVTWMVDDDAGDQCEFRKKRLFAYTLQLFLIFPLNYLTRVLIHLLALLLGMRSLNAQGLLHPLTTTIPGTISSLIEKGTIFIRKDPKKFQGEDTLKTHSEILEYLILKLWTLPFMPPIAIVIYLFTTNHVWHFIGWIALAVGLTICLIGVFVSGAVAAVCTWLWNKLVGKWINAKDDELEAALLCGAPVKRRSLKLRYYATKSKVCKPFAG